MIQLTNQIQNGMSDAQSIENPSQSTLNPSIGTLPPRKNIPIIYRYFRLTYRQIMQFSQQALELA